VYYYHDVKCRDEMYDKDVIMLQVSVSTATLFCTPLPFYSMESPDCHYIIGSLLSKLFTDCCFQNGPQPLHHADLAEI
jgi:hypothetical protein